MSKFDLIPCDREKRTGHVPIGTKMYCADKNGRYRTATVYRHTKTLNVLDDRLRTQVPVSNWYAKSESWRGDLWRVADAQDPYFVALQSHGKCLDMKDKVADYLKGLDRLRFTVGELEPHRSKLARIVAILEDQE